VADNVVKFPKENRRMDVSNIALEPEDVMKKIHLMKKGYFADVADHILDDVLRSIGCMDLEETKHETFPLSDSDLIMIKESIISAMCRIVGIVHPLHEIERTELISLREEIDDEYGAVILGYKFRSEASSEEIALASEGGSE